MVNLIIGWYSTSVLSGKQGWSVRDSTNMQDPGQIYTTTVSVSKCHLSSVCWFILSCLYSLCPQMNAILEQHQVKVSWVWLTI